MNELETGRYIPIATAVEPLSKYTLDALEELGEVLKRIHSRMVREGYELVDGEIRKANPKDVYEKVER